MLIESSDGASLELRIAGYQFPGGEPVTDNVWDANWLQVAGRVQRAQQTWTFLEPCMTTWEAEALLRWLQHAGHQTPDRLELIEPNLAFESIAGPPGAVTILVTLKGEAASPWCTEDRRWWEGELLALNVPSEALAAAAATWERTLRGFPVR